jgi:hypothetical protein
MFGNQSIAFDQIRAFVANIQRFNAMQFNAKTHLLIQTFGEDEGIKYSERHTSYGAWFFIDQLPEKDEKIFLSMILNLHN